MIENWEKVVKHQSSLLPTAGSEKSGGDGQSGEHHEGGDGGGDDSSDDEDPSDDDFDPSGFNDEDKDTPSIRVYVNVSALSSTRNRPNPSFLVNPKWAVRSIKFAIYGKYGISVNAFRFSKSNGNIVYECSSFFENNITDGQSLLLQIRGRAGVGRKVITKHLKEDEARQKLTRKSIESVRNFMDYFETKNEAVPPSLHNIINPMMTKLIEIKRQVAEGQDVLVNALEGLDDNKLELLKDIFNVKQGKFTTEKLLKSAFCILQDLNDLDEFIAHLNKTKRQIVESYVETYSDTFIRGKDGEMVYDNDRFIRTLDNLIAYRTGR